LFPVDSLEAAGQCIRQAYFHPRNVTTNSLFAEINYEPFERTSSFRHHIPATTDNLQPHWQSST